MYDLYQGKIRFIMDAISGIITHFPMTLPCTIGLSKAKELLKVITLEKIHATLSDRELNVLLEMVQVGEFSNIDLSKRLGIQKQNILKYIKKLLETGYIQFLRQEKRKTIYQLAADIHCLYEIINKTDKTELSKASLISKKNCDSSLNLRQTKFLASTRLGDCVTTSQYAKKAGISLASALRDLSSLQTKNYVERFGKRKSTYFKVSKK